MELTHDSTEIRSPPETDAAVLSLTTAETDQQEWTLRIGPGPFPGIRAPIHCLLWLLRVIVGVGFLIVLLASLAAVPGLSLLTLGLMLAAEASVAKSGRLRDAFPLLPLATRFGIVLILTGICLLPLYAAATLATAHRTITPPQTDSPGPQQYGILILQGLVFLHVCAAIACGGSVRCFLRPVRNLRNLRTDAANGSWQRSVDQCCVQLLQILRPMHHLGLALRATIGAVIWLLIPTAMLAASTRPHEHPGGPAVISILGGILLIPVAAWLPLLQAHQAVTGRFRDIFDVRTVRAIIRRVPAHWAIATVLLYSSAVPLYLTKIRLIDAQAVWLLTPLFVVLIYPARVMFGWVYFRGQRRQQPARRLIRWPVTAIVIPLLAAYAGILFLTPLISEAGRAAIFENHAFLLPIPGRLFSP